MIKAIRRVKIAHGTITIPGTIVGTIRITTYYYVLLRTTTYYSVLPKESSLPLFGVAACLQDLAVHVPFGVPCARVGVGCVDLAVDVRIWRWMSECGAGC